MLDFTTITSMLQMRSIDDADRTAYVAGQESTTWRTLWDDTHRIASLLRHEGLDSGDRVAIVMPAGLALIRAFFAVMRLGAVPCIFDPNVPEATTSRRVAAIRPRAVLHELPSSGGSTVLAAPHEQADALAFLQSTSGTSGEPLAAMVAHENVMAALRATFNLFQPDRNDVFAGWVPPWHDLGLLRFVLAPVAFGATCHIITPAISTIPLWFSTMSEFGATVTGAPDFAWRLATRLVDPARVDLRSLRFATNGGEPVRASTIAAFETRFGLERVVRPGYGLAEATLGVTSTRPGEPLRMDERGNVSCGVPLKDVEVRIADGEITVRSGGVFRGYFEAPAATAAVLRDGWLHTGDEGRVDEDGHLYVFGRRRAMIKRGGVALAPRELEEAVQGVEGVRLAAAVGVPSATTEEIVLVVETDRDLPGLERAVHAAVERVLGFGPDRVLVQGPRTIPRTSNGKIRHAVLRDQLTPSSLRSNPGESSPGDSRR